MRYQRIIFVSGLIASVLCLLSLALGGMFPYNITRQEHLQYLKVMKMAFVFLIVSWLALLTECVILFLSSRARSDKSSLKFIVILFFSVLIISVVCLLWGHSFEFGMR